MKRVVMALVLAVFGCTREVQFFPENDEAHRIGVPTATIVAKGVPQGPLNVTMPDGEQLKGRFQAMLGGAVGFASISGGGHSAFASGYGMSMSNPATAAASGPKGTTVTCNLMTAMGAHGAGECQFTPGGARYQIMF